MVDEFAKLVATEPGDLADGVTLLHGAAEEEKALNLFRGIHAAARAARRGHCIIAALPGAQGVERDAGAFGDGADGE